jgi:hypothetical protein
LKAEIEMNVSMNASTALASLAGQAAGDGEAARALKKALEVQAQDARQLANGAPAPLKTSANLPPNLGQHINTTA